MDDVVKKFNRCKKDLLIRFSIGEDYYIKTMPEYNWAISKLEDVQFLKYWKNDKNVSENVVVKKNNEPIINEYKGYTIVVAIDCVKVAMVFDNKLRID